MMTMIMNDELLFLVKPKVSSALVICDGEKILGFWLRVFLKIKAATSAAVALGNAVRNIKRRNLSRPTIEPGPLLPRLSYPVKLPVFAYRSLQRATVRGWGVAPGLYGGTISGLRTYNSLISWL